MPPQQQFRVREKLLRILKMVGASEKLLTTKQIISYLGKYIEQNKLYDSTNMRIVHCGGDLLEDLFGVQEFMIGDFKDVWQLVCPYLIPATNREVQEQEFRSRQETQQSSGGSGTGKTDFQWMSQLPWWYFVDKDSKENDNYDKATASGSIVANSTAYVVDTEYESDTNDSKYTNRGYGDEDRFSEEYEPDSDESSNSDATQYLESDDEHFPLLPCVREDNEETTTTTDTTDVSMDFEIPLEDHWRCCECETVNPPIVGYCQRCWKLRKGWLPTTSISSPGLTKSLTLPAGELVQSFTPALERSSSQPTPLPRGCDVTDGRTVSEECGSNSKVKKGLEGSSNYQSLPFNNCNKRKQDFSTDCNSEPVSKQRNISKLTTNFADEASTSRLVGATKNCDSLQSSMASSDSTVNEKSLKASELPNYSVTVPGLCNICHNNPNDATIVHGKFGHQYCCYRCAKKLKKSGKTCPVCRQPIAFVVKNYICQM